jgi:hypothetical protein
VNRLFLIVLGVLAVLGIAADAPTSQLTSIQIATAAVIAFGFLSPFLYKLVPADGAAMKIITVVVSFVVAAVALLFSGEAHADFSSAAGVFTFGLLVYGEQQLVWNLLKDTTAKIPGTQTPLLHLVTEPKTELKAA